MMDWGRWTLEYRMSASSNPSRDTNGVQSSSGLGGAGAGGVPHGRKLPR